MCIILESGSKRKRIGDEQPVDTQGKLFVLNMLFEIEFSQTYLQIFYFKN